MKKHNYDFSPYDKEENEEEKDQSALRFQLS